MSKVASVIKRPATYMNPLAIKIIQFFIAKLMLLNAKLLAKRIRNNYKERERYMSFSFGKKLGEFELNWIKTYSEYDYPTNRNVVPKSKYYCEKWNF